MYSALLVVQGGAFAAFYLRVTGLQLLANVTREVLL